MDRVSLKLPESLTAIYRRSRGHVAYCDTWKPGKPPTGNPSLHNLKGRAQHQNGAPQLSNPPKGQPNPGEPFIPYTGEKLTVYEKLAM